MADDYAASSLTTGVLAIGGSINGEVETTGDRHWLRVTLAAGTTYKFDVEGSSSGQGTLSTAYFAVLNSSGSARTPYVYDGGPSSSAEIVYTAPVSGTYYLDVGALSSSATGTYKVSAASLGAIPDDYAASSLTTGVLAIGGSINGEVETTGDRDWLRVTLAAGTTYKFDVEGSSSGQG